MSVIVEAVPAPKAERPFIYQYIGLALLLYVVGSKVSSPNS